MGQRWAQISLGVAIAAILLGVGARKSEVQPPPPEAPRATVSGAEIQVRRFAEFRGGRDGLEGDARSGILLDNGTFIFASWLSERPLYVANIGRDEVKPLLPVGAGPGEVLIVSALHRSSSDTIFVRDDMNRRVSVLAPDGAFVGSFRVEIGALSADLVQTAAGHFVFAGWVSSRGRLGQPLHIVERDGTLGASFGESGPVGRLVTHNDRFAMERKLAVEPSGTVLSVRSGSYVFERWDERGNLLGRWDVAPEWFAPKNSVMAGSHLEPPPPSVQSLQVDRHGRIWVLVLRAGEDWRSGVGPPRRPPSLFEILEYRRYVDTQVEVFDPRTFERIASMRLAEPIARFVAPGIAISAGVTDARGFPVIQFWRLSLTGGA